MTKVIKQKLYCKKCKKEYEVPVILSTNSYMIEMDPVMKQRAKDGTLFKNFCPVCNEELTRGKDE